MVSINKKPEPQKTEHTQMTVSVREFDPKSDSIGVEQVERRCEVGPAGGVSLFTDLLGDPLCRIRHSPVFHMLVAELVVVSDGVAGKSSRREIVGMVRGCIKTVTCGKKVGRNGDDSSTSALPVYAKTAYILGLRVSPSHRRLGIGLKLVNRMEEWFKQNGAEYAYLATENDNVSSIKLFTDKCGYSKFRTPSILVQPVFAHRVKIPTGSTIIKLTPPEAETLYRRRFSTTEFFPRDIDAVLNNPLSLGTFLSIPRAALPFPGIDAFLDSLTAESSWAVVSAWNCKDVWKLEVKGASMLTRGFAKTTRVLDRVLPWLKIPSMPEVFGPFGLHFLYGLGGGGPMGDRMVRALCGFAHNLAKERGCGVVATEVARMDPLRAGVPHWKMLSCDEDLWCIKRLGEDYSDGSVGDWTKSPPGFSIFVDPREF